MGESGTRGSAPELRRGGDRRAGASLPRASSTAAPSGGRAWTPPPTGPWCPPASPCRSPSAATTASPLPLVLVGLLVAVFLRSRRGATASSTSGACGRTSWRRSSSGRCCSARACRSATAGTRCCTRTTSGPGCTSPTADALGRRLRRNYLWIFAIQAVSYAGKLLIHPEPIASLAELWTRAAIGPVPGQLVLLAGLAFHGGWVAVAVLTVQSRRGKGLEPDSSLRRTASSNSRGGRRDPRRAPR